MSDLSNGMKPIRYLDMLFSVSIKGLEMFDTRLVDYEEKKGFRRAITDFDKEYMKGLSKEQQREYKKYVKNNPINPQNSTLYNTEGMQTRTIQNLLNNAGIPNVSMIQDDTGKTVIAVPRQFQNQANEAISKHLQLSDVTVDPTGKKFIRQLAANNGNDKSNLLVNGATIKDGIWMQMNGGYHAALEAKFSEEKIPYMSVINTQTRDHYLAIHPAFQFQFKRSEDELRREPMEISKDKFMVESYKKSKNIVERPGFTDAQARFIREQLFGKGAGISLQKDAETGTYTLRYNAEKTQLVEKAAMTALILSNGPHGREVEAQSRAIEAIARDASKAAAVGERFSIRDEANPENSFSVDSRGLRDSSGKLIMSRPDISDPKNVAAQENLLKFQQDIFARIYEMKQPNIKEAEGAIIEGLATKDEIKRAKESAALASPDQSAIAAAQIIALRMEIAAKEPHATNQSAINAGIESCYKLVNSIEEEGYRKDFDELTKELGIPDSHHLKAKEFIEKFARGINEMSPEERIQFKKSIVSAADRMQMSMDNKEYEAHMVDRNKLPIKTLGQTLEVEQDEQEFTRDDAREEMDGAEPLPPPEIPEIDTI